MKGLVLGVHLTSRGFGWVLFESPFSVLDWGTRTAKPGRHIRILNAFEKLLERYEPSVLVMRDYESTNTSRVARIQKLSRNMIGVAQTHGIYVPQFSPEAVRTCFERAGASTRYEIARVVAQHVDALRRYLPKKPVIWAGETPRMSVFDAAALVFTYFAGHGELD
jgi:hypothetical protein